MRKKEFEFDLHRKKIQTANPGVDQISTAGCADAEHMPTIGELVMVPIAEPMVTNESARGEAEQIFRQVYSECLSGEALEERIRERLLEWDADRA